MTITVVIQDGSYKAAVVEFSPLHEPYIRPDEILKYNTEEYVKFIQRAGQKGASIIVFPEYGLTTADVIEKLKSQLNIYSVEIPNPVHSPNPCINESHNTVLRLLSCAANESKIYVVANLIERSRENGVHFFYNTDIVLNNQGTIILRYRKINLMKEPNFKTGNKIGIFTTDFNVTFGILVSWDIFYRKPALDMFQEKNLTDVIYSSSWTSETPFLQGLSLQAGYARATGVNLLTAGLNNPSERRGGSGIYHFDGKVAELFISPAKTSRLLVQEVPKIRVRLSAVKCNNNSHEMPRFRLGGNLNSGSFHLETESLSQYTMVPLNRFGVETRAKLCNGNGMYCCKFHVVLKEPPKHKDLKYRLALFYGVRKIDGATYGIRTCGLVSCLSNSKQSCGQRLINSTTNVIFENISITGNFERNIWSHDQPATLTHDLIPFTEYTYCETLSNNKENVKAEMVTTRSVKNILTFGIHGRLYGYDGLREGVITNSSHRNSINYIFLMYLLIFINV